MAPRASQRKRIRQPPGCRRAPGQAKACAVTVGALSVRPIPDGSRNRQSRFSPSTPVRRAQFSDSSQTESYREPRFAKAALHCSESSSGFRFRKQRPACASPLQNFSISILHALRTDPWPPDSRPEPLLLCPWTRCSRPDSGLPWSGQPTIAMQPLNNTVNSISTSSRP